MLQQRHTAMMMMINDNDDNDVMMTMMHDDTARLNMLWEASRRVRTTTSVRTQEGCGRPLLVHWITQAFWPFLVLSRCLGRYFSRKDSCLAFMAPLRFLQNTFTLNTILTLFAFCSTVVPLVCDHPFCRVKVVT